MYILYNSQVCPEDVPQYIRTLRMGVTDDYDHTKADGVEYKVEVCGGKSEDRCSLGWPP